MTPIERGATPEFINVVTRCAVRVDSTALVIRAPDATSLVEPPVDILSVLRKRQRELGDRARRSQQVALETQIVVVVDELVGLGKEEAVKW